MKKLIVFSIVFVFIIQQIASQTAMFINNSSSSAVCNCWRVQVQRLSRTDAGTINYHQGLEAFKDAGTWRIVSKQTFTSRATLQKAITYFKNLGYKDAFPISGYCYTSAKVDELMPVASPVARSLTNKPQTVRSTKSTTTSAVKPSNEQPEGMKEKARRPQLSNPDSIVRDTPYVPKFNFNSNNTTIKPQDGRPRISSTRVKPSTASFAKTVAYQKTKSDPYKYSYKFVI